MAAADRTTLPVTFTDLARPLSLSAPSRAFFYAAVSMHLLFKTLLGLTLVIDDGYGFRSLLAPPFSLIFTGSDVLVCYGLSKLIDLTTATRAARAVQSVVMASLSLFLLANFIVHTYLKTFLSRGLLEFNGAGGEEIRDYALAACTPVTVAFALVAIAHALLFPLLQPRLREARFVVSRPHLPVALIASAVAAMLYAGQLSAGQSGWVRANPLYELAHSFVAGRAQAIARATPEQIRSFTRPKPLFGSYDQELSARVPSQRGKNVLFVMIESLPMEQTPLGGAQDGLTVMSELARDAVTFTNFRTVFPATSRSFLTYHCGVHPTAGAATITKYQPGYRCDSILDSLKESGYRTGFFTAPMFTYDNLHKAALMRSYDVYEDFLTLKGRASAALDAPAVPEEVVAERLLEFVDSDRATPFFATYFMFWNHAPYRLPHEDISHLPPYERYRRTLAYLDHVLRGVLDQLRARDVLDDTVVIVAADHGEGFALHHDNRNHVGHIYEDDVRIPLLVHVPGIGRHVTRRSASNVDFAPTLAGLLDLPVRASWQGQDLLAAQHQPAPVLLFGRASFATNGIVDGNYKYIEYVGSDQRLLFDLARDPHEQVNLFAGERAKADAYAALIARWLPVVDQQARDVAELPVRIPQQPQAAR